MQTSSDPRIVGVKLFVAACGQMLLPGVLGALVAVAAQPLLSSQGHGALHVPAVVVLLFLVAACIVGGACIHMWTRDLDDQSRSELACEQRRTRAELAALRAEIHELRNALPRRRRRWWMRGE